MKNSYLRRTILCLSSSVLLFSFQNCSKVKYDDVKSTGSGLTLGDPDGNGDDHSTTDDNRGLPGGHFDIETSHLVYSFDRGNVDKHVHQYDDTYDLTYADFFNLKNSDLGNVQEFVLPTINFVVIVANAELSPSVTLDLNGKKYPVLEYQKLVSDFLAGGASLPSFTLSNASGANMTPLKSFKLEFDFNAILLNKLVAMVPSCVIKNVRGKLGEYRDGALTVQVVNVAKLKLDPKLGVATSDGGLLWESTTYYHKPNSGCY